MATPRKKLPDHVYPHLDLARTHAARIGRLMQDVERVMTDTRGINRHLLEKLHAKVGESVAHITLALSLIEAQEPLPDGYDGNGAKDQAWLAAMRRLVDLSSDRSNAEAVLAFIDAELERVE